MEEWMAELQRGSTEAAWDRFLARYRRLLMAAIRHYAQDYDDVMDVFTRVCEALRADDFRRLRRYCDDPVHGAQFSTWLVTVVRHLTVDWLRQRDGRPRISAIAKELPPLRRRIFEHIFLDRRSHVEVYEVMGGASGLQLSFGQFLLEVSATYRAVTEGRRGSLFRDVGHARAVALEHSAESPCDPPPDHDVREALAAVMESLDSDERAAVELYVIDQLPATDVARILGLPNTKAVYNRVYRALAVLRERLARAGIHQGDL